MNEYLYSHKNQNQWWDSKATKKEFFHMNFFVSISTFGLIFKPLSHLFFISVWREKKKHTQTSNQRPPKPALARPRRRTFGADNCISKTKL